MLKQLLDEGFFVWLCYDAFYSTAKDDWNQVRFERHVETLVEQHANKYISELLCGASLSEEKEAV